MPRISTTNVIHKETSSRVKAQSSKPDDKTQPSGNNKDGNNLQIVLSHGIPKEHQKHSNTTKPRYAGFEARTTPKPLTDCVMSLNEDQMLVVASMGLGSILHLRITKVRADLAKWMLGSFNSKTCKFETGRGDLEILSRNVHYTHRLPLG
ncbi:hypothetical protein QQ045_001631 [Rhodiola kirilowii]